MANKFVVSAKSEVPPANVEWQVDLGDDLKNCLIYGNLAYDLVAAVIAKLGVEYSKYIVGDITGEELASRMSAVQDTLRAGTVAG